MTMHRFVALFILLIVAGAAAAQLAPSERILLPVALDVRVSGTNGSLWESRLALVNTGLVPVRVDGINPGCPFDPCVGDPAVVPSATMYPSVDKPNSANPGHFLQVPVGSHSFEVFYGYTGSANRRIPSFASGCLQHGRLRQNLYRRSIRMSC